MKYLMALIAAVTACMLLQGCDQQLDLSRSYTAHAERVPSPPGYTCLAIYDGNTYHALNGFCFKD